MLNFKTGYVDGDDGTDLPSYHSIDIGVVVLNGDILVDLDGNFYFSTAGGEGVSGGFSYTESYLCQGSPCIFETTNVANLISGYCINGGQQVLIGYQVSICGAFTSNLSFVSTYSVGFQAGYSAPGGSYTFPLNSIFPPNAAFGWRGEIGARRNGIHRSDLHITP